MYMFKPTITAVYRKLAGYVEVVLLPTGYENNPLLAEVLSQQFIFCFQ